MSEETVQKFKRGLDAYNRRDVEGLLEVLDPDVEWHPALASSFSGEATVFRGHEGIRELFRQGDEVFASAQVEFSEVRDLGDRLVATGQVRMRGKASGAETESPFGWLIGLKRGKAILVRTYLDPKEALEAAGLSESEG